MSQSTPINRNRFITVYDTDAERAATPPNSIPLGQLVYSLDTKELRIADGTAVWPDPVSGKTAFTAVQLQQFRVGKAGTGANQLGEPTVRIKSDRVGIASFRIGGFANDDLLSGAYVHVGTGVGGSSARPGSAVLRPLLSVGEGGGDVDLAFAPALNGLLTNNLYVARPSNFLTDLTVAESQDYGLTWTNLPPVTGPSVGGVDLDREWMDSFGQEILLTSIWSDNGVNVLRADAYGAPLVKVSEIITAPDWRWGSFWNRNGGSGQLRLQIDKLNTAGTVPPPVPNQLKTPFWCYFGVGAPAAPPDSDPVTTIFFYSSRDGGYTWSAATVVVSLPGVDMLGTFNDLSVAPDGSLWIAYSDMTNVFVTHSTDHGVTWSVPTPVSPSTTFARYPKIIATDKGMGVMFAGTTGPTEDGPWSVYYTSSNNLGTVWAAPTDVIGVVTTGVVRNDDGRKDRTLWDLFGMDVDKNGWAHLVFGADGNGPCAAIRSDVQGPGQGGVGDTAVAVIAVGVDIAAGQQMTFVGGAIVTVTVDAPVGTTALTVDPLLVPVGASETAVINFPSSYYAVQTSGPRLGKTNY
jgi:hypothetical protein